VRILLVLQRFVQRAYSPRSRSHGPDQSAGCSSTTGSCGFGTAFHGRNPNGVRSKAQTSRTRFRDNAAGTSPGRLESA